MFSMLRRSVHHTVKSFSAQNKNNIGVLKNAARIISTSEGVNSNMTRKNEIELDQRQNLKKPIRTLSTPNYPVSLAALASDSKNESREFMAVFPDLVRDLTELSSKYDTNFASQWFAKALEYNVPHGKNNRGLHTVLAYKQLIDPSQLTPENLRLAQYLGWCVEMLQAAMIIADDVMDGSTTRRGQPCWHTVDEVGMFAINDALMIENGMYHILKKYFGSTEYYVKLIELFREATFVITVGQSLDLQTANEDISHFSMEKYNKIAACKTSYYTFYLPVALAMHMAGITDPEVFHQAEAILLEIGTILQVQDDFLDWFGDPAVTGKIGTDIQDKKCSWLAVVCMQRASNDQKEIMKECYGQKDPVKVARVKDLYEELGVANAFAVYEEEFYNRTKAHILQTSIGVPRDIFINILDKIYKRNS